MIVHVVVGNFGKDFYFGDLVNFPSHQFYHTIIMILKLPTLPIILGIDLEAGITR